MRTLDPERFLNVAYAVLVDTVGPAGLEALKVEDDAPEPAEGPAMRQPLDLPSVPQGSPMPGMGVSPVDVDPATWGLTPEALAGQEAMMEIVSGRAARGVGG